MTESEQELRQNALERAVVVLERLGDPELVQAYRRYADRVEELLTPEELATYTEAYQRDRRYATHEATGVELPANERDVRDRVVSDTAANSYYQAFIELLSAKHMLDPDALLGDGQSEPGDERPHQEAV